MINKEPSQLTELLVNEIKSNVKFYNFTTNHSHIYIRCPICGDSQKHKNDCHLYIHLQEPFVFYCQLCKGTGIVNSEFLRSLKIHNTDLNINLRLMLKKQNKKLKKKVIKGKELKIPDWQENILNKFKLKYINSRLGTNLTLADLSKFKIILNLYEFLNYNQIDFLTCEETLGDTLDKNFLGFLSYDNNYIIMRNLSKKVIPKMRYYNYNIHNNYDNTKRFYIMPNQIDLLNPKVKIIIAEGIFDILGIYFKYYKDTEIKNILFIAVNGTGYNLIFEKLARMGFLDMDIEIYSDNDQSINMYKEFKRNMKDILVNRIKIIYNINGKDFGEKLDQIETKYSYI
jgi:hypothetical protein